MSSPVNIPFQSFISIDRDSSTSIYLQITFQFINAIQRGYLPTGLKLPGSRTLSELLGVHRKTIIAVYEELDAQGWVQIHSNRGTFILDKEPEKIKIKSSESLQLYSYPRQTGFSFNKTNILDNPYEYGDFLYRWNDGTPDYRVTQIETFTKFYSASLKRKQNQKKWAYSKEEGSIYFRKQLSNYLNLTRGLHISDKNILITRGVDASIYIISQILLEKGDKVVVAETSYFAINMIFQKNGAQILTIPIDKYGIQVDKLRELCEHTTIRALYLTPHNHYPTTVTLSGSRRMELLQLADEFGFVILEDDYDYEFQYDKNTTLPIASADTNGMVVYVGSFGKTLPPGFRTGFVVAPENLIYEMRKYLGIIDREGDIMMEQVLGELIEEGEIHRHLKKSIKIYQERRNNFANILKETFGNDINYQIPTGGLAYWIEWQKSVNLLKISQECVKYNLLIPRTLLYQNKSITAMRIGFGHLTTEEMKNSIEILSKSIVSISTSH